MELVSESAIVTGGARGIGYAIADALMEHGASVAIADIDVESGEAAAEELSGIHDGRALAVECDVTQSEDVATTVSTAVDEFGDVGILVNNAGLGGLDRTWELDEDEWDLVHDVCLKGTFLCTKEVVGRMVENDVVGSVVNLSSLAASHVTDGYAHYCSAKAGVSTFTKVVAAEAGQYGIRVNAIAPGVVRTPLTEESNLVRGRMREEFLERTPLGRIGRPEDVAAVALFLASETSGWITGETIAADGGQHVWGEPPTWRTFEEMGLLD